MDMGPLSHRFDDTFVEHFLSSYLIPIATEKDAKINLFLQEQEGLNQQGRLKNKDSRGY
jgi:hypothetical protein